MELAVQFRNKIGKAVKALRKEGLVPAELYGRGVENQHISVPVKDLKKAIKIAGTNTIVTVVLDSQKYPTLLNDIQYDPLTDEILNADFYQVRLDEKIRVRVPVEFFGSSPAVKDLGGILVKTMQEIEVEVLPTNLPHSLNADLNSLKEIGQSLHVKDIQVPADVKVLVGPETVIATVTVKITEEKEAPQAATVDVSAIKSETEEKKAEREAKKIVEGAQAPAAEPTAGKPTVEKK